VSEDSEPIRFRGSVELGGRTATGIEVRADVLLVADPAARETFDGLAPGQRKEWVRWVTEAKRPETRADRVVKAAERSRPDGGRADRSLLTGSAISRARLAWAA